MAIISPHHFFIMPGDSAGHELSRSLEQDILQISVVLENSISPFKNPQAGEVRYSESFVELTFSIDVKLINTPQLYRHLKFVTNQLRGEYRAAGWDDLTMSITHLSGLVPEYEFRIKLTYR